MKRFLPLFALLLFIYLLVVFPARGQVPAKPYADLGDGDTLTAAWLIGTFDTIFAWAQNASSTLNVHSASMTAHIASGTNVHGLAAGVAVVGDTATQTLTNKTLTAPKIATISNTGTLTLPVATDTIVGRATTDTLTNKSISGEQINSGTVAEARIHGDIARDSEVSSAVSTHAGLTETHGATGAVVGTTNTQTLTNKTLTAPKIATISNTGTITFPTATDTLVGRATTDTLTNKSISGEQINSGTVAEARIHGDIARDSEVSSAVSTHAGLTATHGVSGALVGTTDTQTLTNKTLSTGSTWSGNTVAVNKGGTNATSFTASQLVRMNSGGTALESSGKTVPTGDIVGTSDTQTLSNKTFTTASTTTAFYAGGDGLFFTGNAGLYFNNPSGVLYGPRIESGAGGISIIVGAGAGSGKLVVQPDGAMTLSGGSTKNFEVDLNGYAYLPGLRTTSFFPNLFIDLGSGEISRSTAAFPSGDIVGTTATQTLSAKTLSYPAITGALNASCSVYVRNTAAGEYSQVVVEDDTDSVLSLKAGTSTDYTRGQVYVDTTGKKLIFNVVRHVSPDTDISEPFILTATGAVYMLPTFSSLMTSGQPNLHIDSYGMLRRFAGQDYSLNKIYNGSGTLIVDMSYATCGSGGGAIFSAGIGIGGSSGPSIYPAGGGGIALLHTDTTHTSSASGVNKYGQLYSPCVYARTDAGAANVYIDSSGVFWRSTSSRRYKKDISDISSARSDLTRELRPITYRGKDAPATAPVHVGLIAEEIHDAGLTELVVYDNQGRPDAVEYDRLAVLLLDRINRLEARVAELEGKQ